MENQNNNQPSSQPGQENATPAKQQQSDSNTPPEIETVTPDTEKEGLAHDQKHNHQPELNQADAEPTADHDPAQQEDAERSGSEQGNSSENQLKKINDAQLHAEENEQDKEDPASDIETVSP